MQNALFGAAWTATPTGRDARMWNAGHLLNEALAAWAQRHFACDNNEVFQECSAYIAAGDYPEWPYQGADELERQYQEHGMQAIRSFVSLLRADPQFAQLRFDELMQAT